MMKIEFGCGEKPTRKDFKTSDIRDLPGVDFVCTAWEIDKHVEESSVDEVFSRHFFEHLTFAQGERVLTVWNKILKPNAICEIILPNMSFHINQWLKLRKDPKQFRHAKAGFWGWQRGEFNDLWDTHKSGYDLDSMIELLHSKKFGSVESLEPVTSGHLHVKCRCYK